MLKERVEKYINEQQNAGVMPIFKQEKEYAMKNQLGEQLQFIDQNPNLRFEDAYIERCDKESENLIRVESASFLQQPLVYLHKHKNEFIYVESKWFDIIQVEAVSLELDDVFGNYDVMLGLRLQKKFDKRLRDYLNGKVSYDLLFNGEEGLWSFNFTLNELDGFNENMSIGEAYSLIYQFLFDLVAAVE